MGGESLRRDFYFLVWTTGLVLQFFGGQVSSEALTVFTCEPVPGKALALEVEDENGKNVKETFKIIHRRPTCVMGKELRISTNPALLYDGHLVDTTPVSTEANERKDYFYPEEFCLDLEAGKLKSARYCPVNCTETSCIQKCCDHAHLLKLDSIQRRGNPFASECIPGRPTGRRPGFDHQKVSLHDHLCGEALKEETVAKVRPHYFSQMPKCELRDSKNVTRLPGHFFAKDALRVRVNSTEDYDFIRFRLLKNGSGTYIKEHNKVLTTQVIYDWFCTHDFAPESDKRITEGRDFGIVFCRKDFNDMEKARKNNMGKDQNPANTSETVGSCHLSNLKLDVYPALFFIASIFLLLSLIVYILLWKKQNIHGWTVAAHITSLLFLNFFFAISYLIYRHTNGEMNGKVGCVIIALILHFFFLSTFFWLTMINFNLWMTFRTMQLNSPMGRISRRLIIYNVISWGIPLLTVIIGLIQDARYKSSVKAGPLDPGLAEASSSQNESTIDICSSLKETYHDPMPYRPGYGEESCYIQNASQYNWIYYPISLLMIINVALFGMTTWALSKHRCSTKKALKGGRSRTQEESFVVFVKLIVVMGLTWTLEFLSKAIEDKIGTTLFNCNWDKLVFICDAINILRAIPIFLIFTCKRQIFANLYFQYPSLQRLLVCSKIPMCAEAINRERSMSHQMTSCYSRDATLKKNGTLNVQGQGDERCRSISVTSSRVAPVIADQPC